MNGNDPDSPVRRMTIAVSVVVAIMIAAALVYVFLVSKEAPAKFNGAAIVAAARSYTRDLKARKEPVPGTVTLDELVSLHFLKQEDVAVFSGLKATVTLTSSEAGPQTVLMRVHFPEGGDVALMSDGSVQQTAPK
jgi:hypothetical protein